MHVTRRALRLLAAAVVSLTAAGCSSGQASSHGANVSVQHALASQRDAGSAATGRKGPCGWEKAADYKHVVWIWMENRAYRQVLGSSGGASHLASYAAACGTATNYDAITHPSLPNYIAASSGSTHGITTDCSPADCPVAGSSLFSQLDDAGLGWRSYAEGMTEPCDRGTHGRYAARHNPAVYYSALAKSCLKHDLAMGGTHGRFARHLDGGHLPAFTFVTPNTCDDGHDCSTATADAWLGYWLHRITTSPAYRDGQTVVFVTWDEDDYSAGNQVATVVIGPTVPKGTRAGRHFTHYSLLRTTEDLLDLGYLRAAGRATSMRGAFNL